MGGCRQTHSLWFFLKRKYWNALFHLDVFDKYFWHDSFGQYINKWLICQITGHSNVQWLSDGGCGAKYPYHHCFNCESEVNPGIDKIRKKI